MSFILLSILKNIFKVFTRKYLSYKLGFGVCTSIKIIFVSISAHISRLSLNIKLICSFFNMLLN